MADSTHRPRRSGVLLALERHDSPPERGIFYNGQKVFDAWSFASKPGVVMHIIDTD
jgi:hypothetical protein